VCGPVVEEGHRRWLPVGLGAVLTTAGLVISEGVVLAKSPETRQEVYVWGRSQAIPGGSDTDVLWPKRVAWFGNHARGWTSIKFGPTFGAALDRQGCVFVWGEGHADAAPVGPVCVQLEGDAKSKKIVDVQCSATKIFLLTGCGETFFIEDVSGSLCDRSMSQQPKPEPLVLQGCAVPGLPQPGFVGRLTGRGGVTQMGIGLEHAAFVTSSGELYCVGGNEWGQCGQEPPRQKGPMGAMEERRRVEVTSPVRVRFPDSAGRIMSVAVGGRHTIATDDNNKSFSFGDDRRIQLGLGDTRSGGGDERHSYGVLHQDAMGGKKVKAEIKRNVTYRFYDPHMQFSPQECVSPVVYNRPPYPPPSLIACGEDFTVAVHRDSPDWYSEEQTTNVVVACGENGEGQCGRGLQAQQQAWTPVRLPKRSKTVAVACGAAHCLALNSKGDLFAWGANQQGQVGNGKRALVLRPGRVVQHMSTEASAKPTMDAEGRRVAPAPVIVELPGRIDTISCGFRNSAVICEVPLTT